VHPICITCGTQFAEPPQHCLVCEDERQYIGLDGQRWTTLEDLRRDHTNKIATEETALTSFHTEPNFAINQRAFLIETPQGNVLWDCISLLDDATVAYIRERNGIAAIAVSHPHYYTTMVDWSAAFDDAPIYLHEADRQWVMRPDPRIRFWSGETHSLAGGITLIRCGGHFEGGTVLHWPQGALLSGDIIQVVPDRRFVSFMYSYPNYIPLNAAAVKRIVAAVEPYQFDRIYGAFPKMTVDHDAKAALNRSAERYTKALT
jgi:glyoxylase-like metal-dependent hydrolase (beta-lactamase superfamily II)